MEIVNATVIRNANHMHVSCLDYEVPVLMEIFGDGSVIESQSKPATKEEVAAILHRAKDESGKLDTSIPDVQLAWEQLQARYQNSKDGKQALDTVYPTFSNFKRAFKAN